MIVVAGGTGRLGRLVLGHLTDRGLPVRVLTRDPRHLPAPLADRVEVAVVDVRDRPAVHRAVDGAQVVVSAVQGLTTAGGPAAVDRDGNRHLVDAAQVAGADVVLLSVLGAAPDSPLELFRMKYAAEQHLAASGVPSTVVQPSAYLEMWIDLLTRSARPGGRPVVLGRGRALVNFVSVVDVAALIDQVITDPSARGHTLQITGPANLTLLQLATAVQHAAGRTAPPRTIPPPMLRVTAATLGRAVPALGRVLRTSLSMDAADHPAQLTDVRQQYPDLPCTSLAQVLSTTSPTT
jgi:NADH dehydrogenase